LLNNRSLKGPVARSLALEKLATAGLTDVDRVFSQYPHELSGGMKQRALIAIALASNPRLLVADEPTSALDVTIQKTILDHLDSLRAEFNLGVLLVTHDLGVATDRSGRLVVMKRGRVVEAGPTRDVVAGPEHPYTRELISAAPSSHSGRLMSTAQSADNDGQSGSGDRGGTELLRVERISKHYGLGRRSSSTFAAVSEATFKVSEGTTHAIVGESGAGKSTIVRLALGLTPPDGGSVWFDGADTTKLSHERRREFRRYVQFVYQNPFSSLDPRFTVRRLIAEPLRIHRAVQGQDALRARVSELLASVSLDDSFAERLPVQLSGGQAQRVAIARAIALRPKLVVFDEAVSALDVSVQAQVLQLLVDLQARYGLTYLFVTHDLGVVRMVADTVSVMRRGKFIEEGSVQQVFSQPRDPYTKALIQAIPGRAVTVGGPDGDRHSKSAQDGR
jgi:peptide/nickel transport system ATP-binding protein